MIAVIGAGIAGLCTARALAHRGHAVTLFEAGSIGASGASSVPVAILNAHRGRSARADRRDVEGLASLKDLTNELSKEGLDAGISWTGVIRVAGWPSQANRWRELHPHAFHTDLDRVLASPKIHAPHGGLFFQEGGWLRPPKFLHTLRESCQRRGVRVLENHRVDDVTRSGNVFHLRSHGGLFEVDKIVSCLGADDSSWAPRPPSRIIEGMTLSLSPSPNAMPLDPNEVYPPIIGKVQIVACDRSVHVGGLHYVHREQEDAMIEELLRHSRETVPFLTDYHLDTTFSAKRMATDDNRPVLYRIAEDFFVLTAFAGRGFLTAPSMANRACEALETGKTSSIDYPPSGQ